MTRDKLTTRDLAKLWCQWNGQRGTPKQIAKVKASRNALLFMLAPRVDLDRAAREIYGRLE